MVSNDLGSVSPPLGPCECRKVNVARNVQDVCFERAGLPDDVPSVQPAFAEVRCFDPPRFGFLRPGIGNLLKRLLDAEVAEGSSFSEEPSDVLYCLDRYPFWFNYGFKVFFLNEVQGLQTDSTTDKDWRTRSNGIPLPR